MAVALKSRNLAIDSSTAAASSPGDATRSTRPRRWASAPHDVAGGDELQGGPSRAVGKWTAAMAEHPSLIRHA
jgi:hypothetical protein